MEFKGWPKTPRLDSPFIITEKIDGTNAAVVIEPHDPNNADLNGAFAQVYSAYDPYGKPVDEGDEWLYDVGAQSRNRLIDPAHDNFGFAAWVEENAQELVDILGVGRHFGEWWGSGIQRGYGLTKGEKRFSLFNVTRYNPYDSFEEMCANADVPPWFELPALRLVPVLYHSNEDADSVLIEYSAYAALTDLKLEGSYAAPGFMRPEGIVLFHARSGQTFKKYVDPDEKGNAR